MPEEKKPKSRLEQILKDKEDLAALRYSAAELERMAMQSENEASKMASTPGGGAKPEDAEAKRKEVIENAIILLNNGVDPRIVGQILSGQNSMPFAMPQASSDKDGLLEKLVLKMLDEKKSAELEAIKSKIEALVDKVDKQGGGAKPLSPAQAAAEYAHGVNATFEAFSHLGLVRQPQTGQGIESLKEEHRHKEEMQRLDADRAHKEKLGEIAAEIPERIGIGLSRGFAREPEGDMGMESFKCEKCHATIYVPPEAGDTVSCGRCGQTYSRKKEKVGQQAGQPTPPAAQPGGAG
jgi:hypothetical protein